MITLQEFSRKTAWIHQFDDDFELMADGGAVFAVFAVNITDFPSTNINLIPSHILNDGCLDVFYHNKWYTLDTIPDSLDLTKIKLCRWIITADVVR